MFRQPATRGRVGTEHQLRDRKQCLQRLLHRLLLQAGLRSSPEGALGLRAGAAAAADAPAALAAAHPPQLALAVHGLSSGVHGLPTFETMHSLLRPLPGKESLVSSSPTPSARTPSSAV